MNRERQRNVRAVHEHIQTMQQNRAARDKGQLHRIQTLEAENKQLKQELEQLKASSVLHPDGVCTCCGEGTCQFCRLMQALIWVDDIKKLQRYDAFKDTYGVDRLEDDNGLYIQVADLDKVFE